MTATTFSMPRRPIRRSHFRFPLGTAVRIVAGPDRGARGRVVARSKDYANYLPYTVKLTDGTTSAYTEDHLAFAPVVGLGATMHYPSDSVALVVTRVTAHTVVTQLVETEAPAVDMASDEGAWGFRPTNARGILDRPIPGTETRWRLNRHGQYVHDGMHLTLGYSITRRDWRD